MLDYLADISNGCSLSEQTFQRYVTIFHAMWRLRGDYSGALRAEPPFLNSQMPADFGLVEKRSWKAIDEAAALALIRDALQWTEISAPVVRAIVDRIWEASRKCIAVDRRERAKIMNTALHEVSQSAEYLQVRGYVGLKTEDTRQVVRRLLALTEGAAAVILLFLVGMRVSELLSLTATSLRTHLHSDGHMYEYLSGIAAKKRGLQRLWVVSPSVKAALQTMVSLLAGPRSVAKRDWLFVAFSGTSVLPLPGRRIVQMRGQTLGKRLRLFANATFRLEQPSCGRLHPHAARKTFARFVVLRDKRALGALAHHYGHVHREYTDTNYVGHDLELAAMLSEENRRDLANALTDILQSKNLAGKGSKSLKIIGERTGEPLRFRGKKALARTVEKLINDGVTLAPCDWGYCVYVQSMSACSGGTTGPNPVERSPDICGGCANLVVTQAHRSWWNARAEDIEVFLAKESLNEQSRLVARRRKVVVERILMDLNEDQKILSGGSS